MTSTGVSNIFSPTYHLARSRFIEAAATAGGVCTHFSAQQDTQGEKLATDILWLGNAEPEKVLLIVSGIHGIEGFAGSAIQLALLRQLPPIAKNFALVMVHSLNPYGMANLRRFNSNNVDLNRNFHFTKNGWEGVPKGYSLLDPFLNPRSKPKFDFFHLKLFMAQLSLGEATIRQAVAEGQYHYPKGIFYGGNGLEPEAARYIEWFKSSPIVNADQLMVIDFHTGLGDFGEQSVFLRSEDVSREELSKTLGIEVASDEKESTVMGYDHSGGSSELYRQLFTGRKLSCLTVEYGTYSGRRLLYALRAENQHHNYGDQSLNHWSKRKLKEAFYPASHTWKEKVLAQGLELGHNALKYLTSS